MSVSDEERRDANKTGELISKKLFAIMDLQADIDALLREKHPTPFGSKNWHVEVGGRVVYARLAEFRPSILGNDHAQVVRVTMIRLRIEEDLLGAGATFRPLNEHFHRDRLVDPLDGFHRERFIADSSMTKGRISTSPPS